MKILAIRGSNLASLEGEFEINFTAEPLKSAGIFAITGQTGAGKSTILDALCLALFDDAPRFNKAESIRKEDLESLSDKISPQDCRNILRRGAGEGYAEVDFIALNGDKYRSRWTVRRARGKSDGALQATTMSLENLTRDTQEQGTKKDLLTKVTEIIGLTFDQFVRAVLLAQGDFANFLKAKQNEKAELLEKLTGTEVYSRISMMIYQKAGEARNSLDLIQQRIKDIRLLTDEELEAYDLEKENLTKEINPLNLQKANIEKKLDWLQQEELLKNEILKAENELKTIQEKLTESASRYEYISQVDLSQEIRDSYIELTNKQLLSEKLESDIRSIEEKSKAIQEKLKKTEESLATIRATVNKTEEEYNSLKPELAQAKELDFKIESTKEKLTDLNKEIQAYQNQADKTEQLIASLKTEQAEAKRRKDELSEWFTIHADYESIVPKTDYIISLIRSSATLKKQQETVSASMKSGKDVLNTYTGQLKQHEQEAERLNNLLPAEVLNLRNKLEEGTPCPVCGSVHHPLHKPTDQQDRIEEKSLEAEKKKIADAVALTKENIEKTKKSITEFEVHAANFQTQYNDTCNELKESLNNIPQWESDFNSGTLQSNLTVIITQWNKNKQLSDTYNRQLENNSVRLESENKSFENTTTQLNEKRDSQKTIQTTFNDYTAQRQQLLGNKQVEEVEAYYSKLKLQNTRQYELLRTEKENIEKEKSITEGSLNQLKKDRDTNSIEIEKLNAEIQLWLQSKNNRISPDLLKDLMSKSHEWISQEKNYLNDLKNQELVCKTTFAERTEQLNKHKLSDKKLQEGETKESLSYLLTELSDKTELINQRLNEINANLLTHQRGKEQIEAFENELNEKTELYNNWAKLNELLGSASGNKFKTIAQGYTLDVLLSYANKHLEELTRRYKLEKVPGTLALQVIDNDMLGEVRTVHSLSGGESFLISLALALGLSSLSSNRMKIESLFIDEGFGALDIETLSIAMDALDNLHTQGRKIGVISHVEEMKERITTQIQVIKSSNGRSHIQVIG